MKYIYVENGLLNGVGEVRQIGDDVINLEISEEKIQNWKKKNKIDLLG